MGATRWDAEVQGVQYDFRKMNYEQKKQWYGLFMDGVRALYGRDTRSNKRRGRR